MQMRVSVLKMAHKKTGRKKARLRGLFGYDSNFSITAYCSNGSHPGKLPRHDNIIVFKETIG
jgi:hypothetical protein